MANIEFLIKFYTHPIAITILATVVFSIIISLVYYKLTKNISFKKKSLIFSVFSSTFLWLFIVLSIILCTFYEFDYLEYPLRIIKIVASLSTIGALLFSLAISSIVYHKASHFFVGRLPLALFTKKEKKWINEILIKYRLPKDIKFKKINIEIPNAFSVTGNEKIIFLTRGLLKNLNFEEIASVVIHEVSHVNNEDSKLKIYLSVMTKFIFFDPILRFARNKISKEMELTADEYSARYLQSKNNLISALNKINGYYLSSNQISMLPSIYTIHNKQSYFNERIKNINSLDNVEQTKLK